MACCETVGSVRAMSWSVGFLADESGENRKVFTGLNPSGDKSN